ncbi:MAG: AMP-binding protein, partial [Pseudomonadota bacterium]
MRLQLKTRDAWVAAREACVKDPGAYHGGIAASTVHWFVKSIGESGAWLCQDPETKGWSGWDAKTLKAVTPALPEDFAPWDRAFNGDDAPFFKWFEGGLTNACFNEVDRHVLAGHGAEAAIIFEGDRWDMSLNDARGGPVDSHTISRKDLLLETTTCAVALKKLGLKAGDRIAINMPNIPQQVFWIEAAKRLGILYTPVFGGFSDKTLSDRIHDFGARVVITADGGHRNSQIIPFKTAFTDPALDNFVGAQIAKDIVAEALGRLTVSDADKSAITEAVKSALSGETTVERSDVMRGVGRALAASAMDAAEASKVRTEIAGALVKAPARVEAVIVERHAAQPDMLWRGERDRWAHDLKAEALQDILAAAKAAGIDAENEEALLALSDNDFVRAIWASVPPRAVDAEFPMFVIYTSGSTGKPKGVVHVHGGYTAGIAATMSVAFDAEPGDTIYVVADPGWITGQSYLISAPLLTRVTTVIAEGAPVYPHAGRFASIIERYNVKIFKAGVTFLKTVMTDPESIADVKKYDLSGLKAATFCAEPTSPAVQEFGMREITAHYANSYWATEHGGIAWTHFFGNEEFALEANAHAYPLPWVFGDIWMPSDGDAPEGAGAKAHQPPSANFMRKSDDGTPWRSSAYGEKGEIVITAPYPYLARTVWGDNEGFGLEGDGAPAGWKGDAERYTQTYWSRWKDVWAYTQGDFGVAHPDGSISIHGRSDDVINVSGHRLGTEEIEGAILKDKANNPENSPVGNVIVVGAPHSEKGLTPLAFITPTPGKAITQEDRNRLSNLVRSEKGSLAIPGAFIEVSQFPETRSGKYMRRMVRALVEGSDVGDASALKNPESLEELERAIGTWRKKQTSAESQAIFERYRFFRIQYNKLGDAGLAATVFVSNPPVNALNERALDELNIIVDHLERRSDVKAIVFTGSG